MKPSLEICSVHLRVADLERSAWFYHAALGFTKVGDAEGGIELAADPDARVGLLRLTEDRTAPRAPVDSAGLFHAALLLPTRATLARWLRHTARFDVQFDGFSDHGVSEAVYLRDPDGNGLEFYADRPRDNWPRAGTELRMTTEPLDVDGLLRSSPPNSSAPALPRGARWGHLHFRVADLDATEAFYSRELGATVTQHYGTAARFLAVDGYHHHFGLNTWGGVRQTQPPHALGFVEATLATTHASAPRNVTDPNGLHLHLVPLET